MKKWILLIILLVGILFPVAATSRLNPGTAKAFDLMFNSLLAHILMHSVLFAALSWLVLSFCSKLSLGRIALICLGSVFVVALVQESIQLISAHVWLIKASLFDIGVDLFAGSIPILIFGINRHRKPKAVPS